MQLFDSLVTVALPAVVRCHARSKTCVTAGADVRVVGGARFYERLEIRDALAYLRVVAQPSDDLALEVKSDFKDKIALALLKEAATQY